jgi:Mg2+ and Co2+ transporter CorA
MRSLVILAASALVAFAAPALAQQASDIEPNQQKYKCTSKDAVGGWSMVFFERVATQCTFTVDNDRTITSSSCIEKKTDKEVATLEGKIVVDKKCTVTANLTIKAKNASTESKLDAYMTFDQTAFTGLLIDKKSDAFVAVAAVRAK